MMMVGVSMIGDADGAVTAGSQDLLQTVRRASAFLRVRVEQVSADREKLPG
jgi:hypothetical protein